MNFKYYNHLGFHNPYYLVQDEKLIIESSFEEAIKHIPVEKRELDYTGLVEVFSSGFCFGDRTLIKGLQKSPWMARPNKDNTGWEYFKVPDHGEIFQDVKTIATTFTNLLENELIAYVESHQNIGLLLTGGMDSRIVAAILKKMLDEGRISEKKIYAFTWGHEKSRDVVYAARIAKMYGWNWKHLVVDEEQLEENCNIAIKQGCEFTPIHLHAMPQVVRETHLDCVIAGSFGDSVGRAEFSGRKVEALESLVAKIQNVGGILRRDFRKLVMTDVMEDLSNYTDKFPQNKPYQQYEQDQQLHYMRRMLNACMRVIDKKIPLYQMFTSPNVFGYMWSLSPKVRTDEVYKVLLENIAPELLDIPWARTGLRYPETEGVSDSYAKKHHDYGKMIRNNYLAMVKKDLVENENVSTRLFDVKCIMTLLDNLKKFPVRGGLVFEDRVLLVGQVLNFIKQYDLRLELPTYKSSWVQSFSENVYYKGKYFYKKLR